MAPISIPVASRLPSSLRLDPTHPAVVRLLGRLSRPSLLALALEWLDDGSQALTAPYLGHGAGGDNGDGDSDDLYPPAASLAALQELYGELQARKGSKRDVLDRMLEGDWRHGISMYQLAMADLQYLYDHPTSQRWTAYRMVPLRAEHGGRGRGRGRNNGNGDDDDDDDNDSSAMASLDTDSLVVPRFHPSTFLRNLQAQILPDVKVHYNFDRHKQLPLLLLRIFLLDSPYNTAAAAATTAAGLANPTSTAGMSSRTIYVAFPDASPFVYLSSATHTEPPAPTAGAPSASSAPSSVAGPATTATPRDVRSLRSLLVEALPKALSRPPRERYALQPTGLVARGLAALLHRRGAGRTNAAGGGWAIYADESAIESPLSAVLPTPPLSEADDARPSSAPIDPTAADHGKRPLPMDARERAQQSAARQRRRVAAARFGLSARMDDGCGVERLDVVLRDAFPGRLREDELHARIEDDSAAGAGADAAAATTTLATARGRRPKGGRRSHIDTVLAREARESMQVDGVVRDSAEDDDDDDDDDDDVYGSDAEAAGVGKVWRPRVAITFHGPHVFAGVRQLVEAGVIDGTRMPGWLTGEEGVTVGVVRHGRIRGHKGSGMP